MKKFELISDCISIDIEGISLCDTKVHGTDVSLFFTMGVHIKQKDLKEFIKNIDKLQNSQWWKINFEKIKGEQNERII